MKLAGSGTCLLTSALLVAAAAAWSQDTNSATTTIAPPSSAVADGPYATIVARNMFGLVPIPPPDPDAGKPPEEAPPKITPNGIMTIFGKDQALFKVANKPKPGQPAKDDSYVLAEGDMQDEITVVKINHVDGIITFNNHGTIQDLPLVPAKDGGGGPGPGSGPGAGNRGAALARLNAMNQQLGAGGIAPFQGRIPIAGGNNNIGNPNPQMGMGGGTAGNAGNNGISYLGGTPVNANRVYQPQPVEDGMTPEQSALLIETQRKVYEQQGNPLAPALPPTRNGVKELLDQIANPPQ